VSRPLAPAAAVISARVVAGERCERKANGYESIDETMDLVSGEEAVRGPCGGARQRGFWSNGSIEVVDDSQSSGDCHVLSKWRRNLSAHLV
jgi:hypothetical protein